MIANNVDYDIYRQGYLTFQTFYNAFRINNQNPLS